MVDFRRIAVYSYVKRGNVSQRNMLWHLFNYIFTANL